MEERGRGLGWSRVQGSEMHFQGTAERHIVILRKFCNGLNSGRPKRSFQLGILWRRELLTLDKGVLLAVAFWFELVPLMASWLGEPVDASSYPLMITAPCHNYNQ